MTTLTEARRALLQLANLLPAPSIYATHLAILSDYFDNQVPLNVENNALIQRLAVSEAFAKRVSELLQQSDPVSRITNYIFASGDKTPLKDLGDRRFMAFDARDEVRPQEQLEQCVGGRCECIACRVRANA